MNLPFKKDIFCLSLFALFMWIPVAVFAQTGTISGSVRSTDGTALTGATLIIDKLKLGSTADKEGRFEIRNIPAGNHTLKISYTGYITQDRSIQVTEGQNPALEIVLEEDELLLEESVVTGTPNKYMSEYVSKSLRLQSKLVDIPQNIVVVDKSLIQDQNIFNVLDGISRNVSGVRRDIHWDNAYAVLNIRGSRITGSFRNGISMYNYVGPLMEDMSFVERVEFIKGPAGFMLSNSEPGGFYNIVTKKPTGSVKNEVSLLAGSFRHFRGTADLDGVIGKKKKLLYRLNVMGQHKSSWIEYDYNNRFAVAPVLTYKFSDRTSLTAEYTFQHVKFAQVAPYAFSGKGFKDLPVEYYGGDTNLDPNKIKDHSAFLSFEHSFNTKWSLNAQAAYSKFTQIGQYLWPVSIDAEGNTTRAFYLQDLWNEGYMGQISVNGTIPTKVVTQRILVGLDAAHKAYLLDHNLMKLGFLNNIYHPTYGIPEEEIPEYDHGSSLEDRANYRGHYSYLGLYVQDELQFFKEKLRVTLGGRFSMTSKNSGTTVLAEPEITKSQVFTPRVGISGTITNYLSAYGLYDVAFIEQQGADIFGTPFDPLKGRNLEAGLKWSLFKEKVLATVAYFNIHKNNALTNDAEYPGFMKQTGKIVAQGLEIDIMGQVTDGLHVVVNYALTDSEITEDSDATLVGSQTPGTAKHIVNGWIQYQLPKTKLKGLGASFGVQYQAKRYITGLVKNEVLPDNYLKLDAGISWTRPKYRISLLVNNLLNEYLYTGAIVNQITSAQYYWQTEAPRNFTVSASYRF